MLVLTHLHYDDESFEYEDATRDILAQIWGMEMEGYQEEPSSGRALSLFHDNQSVRGKDKSWFPGKGESR